MASTIERLALQLEPLLFNTGSQNMSITTLSEVLNFLKITSTDWDDQIEALIPLVESDYLNIRNIPFDLDESGIVYPPGSATTAALMIQFHINNLKSSGRGVVTSESIDSYSISFKDSGSTIHGYPKYVVASIKRFTDGR